MTITAHSRVYASAYIFWLNNMKFFIGKKIALIATESGSIHVAAQLFGEEKFHA